MQVHIRVKKMLDEDKNSVLMDNPVQVSLPEYPGIHKDEFLLGEMNSD
jgi:hypothetical protein